MSGTELNFTARLDTSQFLSQVDQARTQFSLAFGPMGMGGGAGGFAGAAQAQMQGMIAGLNGPPPIGGSGFGQTFTNPAIAYSPFYGAVQATTQLDQEWAVHRYGMAAAERMKPPGVSAADYALGVEKNFINRQLEATHAANMAARSSFQSGTAGLVAGEAASMIATPLGAMAGGALATRLFGAGAGGAGALVGGLAAGWYAFDAASEFVGGKIQEHYSEAERIGGLTRELGEIAGSGRNLKRTQRYDLGVSARQAAGDLHMDVQEMGDVLALGRQAGMLPNASDPSKAREQYRDFARAIEEGAQILGTSLAGATQVIKMATSSGMTAQEGVIRAAGAGGADAFMQQMAFGQAGAGVGRGMGFTGAQGSGVFMSALGGASSAGLSGEEMKIMGGRFGAAQFLGTTQMSMARSPMGNMQMMAAMGGGGMGGMGLADLPGAALDGLMSGGGDFMSNMGRFMVHQNEYRRGIGAGGIRTLSRAQLSMGGDMINQFMPDLSASEAQRMYAQSMGLDPDQAKLLVGGSRGGGGGGMGGLGQMQAIVAMQSSSLSGVSAAPEGGGGGFGWGYAKEGAALGAIVGGGPLGAGLGAGIGWLAGNASAIGSALFDGPGLFDLSRGFKNAFLSDPQLRADFDQRKMAAEYESRLGDAKARMGYLDIDPAAGQRFLGSNLRGARLDLDAVGSPIASDRTGMMMSAMGVRGMSAGPGTIKVDGVYRSATDAQVLANQQLWAKPVGEKDLAATLALSHNVGFGANIDRHALQSDIGAFVRDYKMVQSGEGEGYAEMWNFRDPGADLLANARRLISAASSTGAIGQTRTDLLGRLDKVGGLMDPKVRAALQQITGQKMESLQGAFMAGRGGAAAMAAAENLSLNNEASFLQSAYHGHGGSTHFVVNPNEEIYGQLNRWSRDLQASHSANNPLGASYYKDLQSNRHYLEAKEASLRGHNDDAKRLLQTATMEVQVAGGDRYRDVNMPVIDPNAVISRPGAQDQATATLAIAKAMRALPGAGNAAVAIQKLELSAMSQAAETTTWAKQVKNEHDSAMAEQHKAKRRAMTPPMERAIGFGEQESAMTSINRSLKSTERSLASIEKKFAGAGANPQGTTVAGGKP